jgi:hypothetical protein
VRDISLHILDIGENSINAGAKNITITVNEDKKKNLLLLEISDDGMGMNKEFAEKASDPFVTTRITRKVGLGISLLKEAAKAAEGGLKIIASENEGTIIKVWFKYDHIDRKPLGNIADTIISLILMSPDTEIKYIHRKNDEEFVFDTKEIKKLLDVIALNDSELLEEIKNLIINKLELL